MENPICPPFSKNTLLIETFGYIPELGVTALDHHLKRLEGSAKVLGFKFNRESVQTIVAQIRSKTRLRCRLTLSQLGQIDLETHPIVAESKTWKVAIASQSLRSDDFWLRHKTTQRSLYDKARQNMPNGVDELIFANERGEFCEGTITNLFVHADNGNVITPAVSCGLLPGIFRQIQLDTGQCTEGIVTVIDLQKAKSITLGNSLRGEIKAEIVDVHR